MHSIYGVPVFLSEMAMTVTGKVHAQKRWHTRRAYHHRVAKKWAKRYGPPKREPTMYAIGAPGSLDQKIIMHPELWKRVQRELANRG